MCSIRWSRVCGDFDGLKTFCGISFTNTGGIPTSSGRMVQIAQLGVDEACKTLQYMTCPSGNVLPSIMSMHKQAQEWIDKVKSNGLHWHYVWFTMEKQFWPVSAII